MHRQVHQTPRGATKSKALLKTYRRKRDFRQTSEPSGSEPAAGQGDSFVVQKHAASHLHYDFRLEMDGVLKSWAVAKGPSVDPAVKRLAIEVEDHPLPYGEFEGTIPKGQYGGGTVMLWDRGTWEPVEDPHRGLKAGRMKFRLKGEKMKGQWALVRMKPRPADRHSNWLLIKDRDENAVDADPDKLLRKDKSVKTNRTMDEIAAGTDVWQSNRSEKYKARSVQKETKKSAAPAAKNPRKKRSSMPAFVPPQLATRVDAAPDGDEWLHEIKFDGYRLHARVDAGDVQILTRHGENWTRKFNDLAAALRTLPIERGYIDGEAVILNNSGISDFSALQAWFKAPGEKQVAYYVFDLLFLNGQDLREEPLTARKELLRTLLEKAPSGIRYSDHQVGHGPAFFETAAGMNVEGIVSKIAEAPYTSGRTRGWLKTKRIERQEFVIGGYTLSTKDKSAIGALLLGEYQAGKLIYVGKVGTGYTVETAQSLFATLGKIKAAAAPFDNTPREIRRTSIWVKPKLVAQIEFGAWTADHILRHAAFLGLREDKTPKDVKTEDPMPVEEITDMPRSSRSKKPPASGNNVAGVTISHPERLIYSKERITKLDVARYYEAVSSVMLPHIADRPLSLLRCPDGVGPACFFQKHAGAGLPKSVREHRIGAGKGDAFLTINSVEGLISLAQRGVLEFHTWGSHLNHPEQPDLVVFDFDPDPTLPWRNVTKAAVDMRDFLKKLGLKSFAKTTGGKGLHVVAPLTPGLDWDGIKRFAKLVATAFAALDAASYVVNMAKKVRGGRIFIDYLRNGRGATAVAPYSLRARPGALVATPVSWDELEDGAIPRDFTISTVPRRIGSRFSDPWKKMEAAKQSITVKMIETLSN